jgi:hypothetical protein
MAGVAAELTVQQGYFLGMEQSGPDQSAVQVQMRVAELQAPLNEQPLGHPAHEAGMTYKGLALLSMVAVLQSGGGGTLSPMVQETAKH